VLGDHRGSVVRLNSNEVRLSHSDAAREGRPGRHGRGDSGRRRDTEEAATVEARHGADLLVYVLGGQIIELNLGQFN
jgi:hypothetical protein